jgi:hypothetical protein
MAERVTVPSAFLRAMPPWLQRRVGKAVVQGIGDVVESVVLATAAGVRARFPMPDVDPSALAETGAERRIRRGPGESTATYAARLLSWWEAHRHRGSPYQMIAELFAFFHSSLPMRMDVVSQLGDRHWIAAAATAGDQVTHDAITWDGNGDLDGTPVLLAGNALPGAVELRPIDLSSFPADRAFPVRLDDGAGGDELVTALGTSTTPYDRIVLDPATPVVGTYLAGPSSAMQVDKKWAHLWVFFYVTGLFDRVVTAADEVIVTDAGDTLIATSLFSGAISDEDAEMFRAIPREWSAAHIPYVTVVLLYTDPTTGADARLWNYPQPVPTWTAWRASGATWGSPEPVILIAA